MAWYADRDSGVTKGSYTAVVALRPKFTKFSCKNRAKIVLNQEFVTGEEVGICCNTWLQQHCFHYLFRKGM